MLYLIATPIGNLKDITYRAVETLNSSDYILCEDTSHSHPLLKTYNIKKPLYSYHKFNEAKQVEKIIEDLKKGLNISLISDAGTPGICDPGQRLVLRCIEEDLPYTALPGPCAAIMALTLTGKSEEHFQFIGFLPKKDAELKTILQELRYYKGISICYESPHRILKTLKILSDLDENLPLSVARELTKMFEECKNGPAKALLTYYTEHPPRGEIVLLISGAPKVEDFQSLSIKEHVEILEKTGLPLKDAIKAVATLRNIPKKHVYNTIHQEKQEGK